MTATRALQPQEHVPLRPLSTIGVGGNARWLVAATSTGDVDAAHQWSRDRGVPLLVLGGGSNVIVADEGIDGLVLQIRLGGVTFERESGETLVRAGAGESWDDVVAASVARGLAGLECLSGIPGTVGGTPIQNVGAYGQEVSSTIESVVAFDRMLHEMCTLAAVDCAFAYRTSRFKSDDAGRFVICGVTFRLAAGDATVTYPDVRAAIERSRTSTPTVGDVRTAVLAVRRGKGMVVDQADPDSRSVGSFFMNPVMTEADRERIAAAAGERVPGFGAGSGQVKVPAAWLIERAGFTRGYADGQVGISTRHTLAIVNRGAASAAAVVGFAARIKRAVSDRFGVLLRPEPVFAGFGDNSDLSYLMDQR
jgi:UDP-N-acetylmuramate dehydrogenase